MRKAVINATLYDFKTFIPNAVMVFDDHVIEVGTRDTVDTKGLEVIDASGMLLMPGLVTGHTHIYSAFARGLAVPFNPNNFQDILDQLWWKIDRNLDNEAVFKSAVVDATDYVLNGVTTLIDHHASGRDIRGSLNQLKRGVCETVGLRGSFAFETSDRFNVQDAIKENRDFIDAENSQFTRGMFGLHASLSLSDETLNKVKKHLKGAPIHIHVAESKLDQDDCMEKYGCRVVERLDQFGLLSEDSILVHALYVDDNELAIIKKRGCTIAVNVTSNMNNGVGLPDIPRFIENDIPVIIGNDGIAASMTSEYLNVFYSMHHHKQTPTAFSHDDLLHMIRETYRYASRHFGVELGRLRKGAAADFMLVPYTPPTPLDENTIFGHLFFGLFSSFRPKMVVVGGKVLVENYAVSEALKKQYKSAQKTASSVWHHINQEAM